MIALLQKIKFLNQFLLARMIDGFPPSISDTLILIRKELGGRRFGSPLTKFRAAVPGLPIGGETGLDIKSTFDELLEDLNLLYQSTIRLASQTIDVYEVFSVRKDRLALKINQLRLDVETLLAQVGAVSRSSVFDSFNTLDNVDPDRTTVQIDLEEGIATLPPDSTRSVKYDGSRARVVKVLPPPNSSQPGPAFESTLTQYRLDSWYIVMPVGSEFQAHVNATGLDYDAGARGEILVNGIRIEPNGPVHVEIEWSPEGRNWHKLNPNAASSIRSKFTFNFNPVRLGFLRFKLRHTEEVLQNFSGQLKQLGVKRIELLLRGFKPTAQLFSSEYRFPETVHTVIADMEASTPYGTRIIPYIAQAFDGPWTPISVGEPVKFNVISWLEYDIKTATAENSGNPSTMWEALNIAEGGQPLPETGELIAGRNQMFASAYKFDWKMMGDRDRIPIAADWVVPLSEVRSGVFSPLGDLNTSGDVLSTSFIDEKNPLAVDIRSDESYTALAIIQGDGTMVLQPGYNYRFRVYVWCQTPTTLERQKIGVVNTNATNGIKIAPLSLYINGLKVFQQDAATTGVSGLNDARYQTTVAFNQGWNAINLYVQVPADIVPGSGGVAASNVFIYLQPNVFAPNLEQNLGIKYIQAYVDPWKRLSEFDLRYNTPVGIREVWAWKTDFETDVTTHVLLNHDPTNSRNDLLNLHPSYRTIDGVNAGQVSNLLLRYPTERNIEGLDTRTLYFRADFFQDPGSDTPPVLGSYRLIIN